MKPEKEQEDKKILEMIARKEAENEALKKILLHLTQIEKDQSLEQTKEK